MRPDPKGALSIAVIRRREFLAGTLAAGVHLLPELPALAGEVRLATLSAEKLGWQVSVQLFTYRRWPLLQALEQVAARGLRHAEIRTGLKFDADRPSLIVNETLSADARKDLRAACKNTGVSLTSIFADFDGSADQARRVFDFCQEIGARMLVAEPPVDAFDLLEKLCEEHALPLAIHNHQIGSSRYWNPDAVLAVCKGRSQKIGACCDSGQWARSGLDPVECLQRLQGRILSFHLKDIARKGDPKSRNTVFGEGEGSSAEALKALKRLGYKGLVTIDFEHDTPALQEDMARNVAFIEEHSRNLL